MVYLKLTLKNVKMHVLKLLFSNNEETTKRTINNLTNK